MKTRFPLQHPLLPTPASRKTESKSYVSVQPSQLQQKSMPNTFKQGLQRIATNSPAPPVQRVSSDDYSGSQKLKFLKVKRHLLHSRSGYSDVEVDRILAEVTPSNMNHILSWNEEQLNDLEWNTHALEILKNPHHFSPGHGAKTTIVLAPSNNKLDFAEIINAYKTINEWKKATVQKMGDHLHTEGQKVIFIGHGSDTTVGGMTVNALIKKAGEALKKAESVELLACHAGEGKYANELKDHIKRPVTAYKGSVKKGPDGVVMKDALPDLQENSSVPKESAFEYTEEATNDTKAAYAKIKPKFFQEVASFQKIRQKLSFQLDIGSTPNLREAIVSKYAEMSPVMKEYIAFIERIKTEYKIKLEVEAEKKVVNPS